VRDIQTNVALTTLDYIDATEVTILSDEPEESYEDSTLIGVWLHDTPADTRRAYEREIYTLLNYLDAGRTDRKRLRDVSLVDLQQYDTSVLRGKAPASRARAIAATRSLYKTLTLGRYITFNPAAFLKTPKLEETQTERYLTPEQVEAITAQAKTQRDRTMMNLMYFTGMRVSEVVALTWKDITPSPSGATIKVFGKGSKTRYIYIDEELTQELNALHGLGADCVFPSGKTGKCMTTTQAQRIVVDAAAKAGIDASPHYFRHAHISHLWQAGVTGPEIRDEAGHANIATTSKYAHSVSGKALGSVLRRK